MKKYLFALVGAVALVACLAVALDDIPIPTGGLYDGTATTTAAIAVETAARVAADTAQADTNVTTVITAYTPRRVGDILVGGAGTGTNGVWVATGATTNGWTQVAP